MNINWMTILILVMTVVKSLAQAPQIYTREYWRAMRDGADAKVTIAVSDEDGRPVTNANVRVFFRMQSGPTQGKRAVGITNNEGEFTAEGRTTDIVFIGVEKPGCYTSRAQHNAASRDAERLKNGRWLPWNPTIPVVLREIRNPIPMYVKIFDGELTNGATYGFDCKAGDFVKPYGRGVESDFMVTCKGTGIPGTKTAHSIEMVVSDPAGGFMAKKKHSSSAFKADYLAPEQGYSTNIFAKMEYDSQHGVSGSSVFYGDEYLVFKSRIKRDEEGNIVSANYGKFYSGIEFMRGVGEHVGVGFLYYFNPTPNDRNIEFDGKNNLFKPGWNSKLNWSREP